MVVGGDKGWGGKRARKCKGENCQSARRWGGLKGVIKGSATAR